MEEITEFNEYVIVEWPDSQIIMEQEWYDECYLINDDKGLNDFGSSAYFVPKKRFMELIKE